MEVADSSAYNSFARQPDGLPRERARSGRLVDEASVMEWKCVARCGGAAARGGGPHAETPLKATKATTMLLPAAAAVCALAASQCCPLETPLKATKATTILLPAAAAVCVLAAVAMLST
ncbi:hypothetical protein T492DRAFT_869973 [Pavlovales sp. CCMP2436]|nr:hypothetical protein T492DRAFT_869973 [Pavlovales sp. CCMP2436]